jgi:hypothetical protein
MTNYNLVTTGTVLVGAIMTGGVTEYWKAIPIQSAPTGSEQDTGYDLPANAELLETRVYVKTAEATGATKTLDVGLKSGESGGDADGFIDGLSVAAVGLARPAAVITDGATEEYLSATTIGALIAPVFSAGTNTAGDVGTNYERSFLTSSITAKSVTYTAGSNDWVEFRGTLYLHIREYA